MAILYLFMTELILGFQRYWNPNISLRNFVVVFIKYQAPIQSNNYAHFEASAFYNQTKTLPLNIMIDKVLGTIYSQ